MLLLHLIAVSTLLLTARGFAAGDYAEDFNDGLAQNWSVVSGTWQVSGGSYNATMDASIARTVYDGATWSTDYTYTLAMQSPQAGSHVDKVGAVYNYVDTNNHYVLVLTPFNGTADLWTVVNGTGSIVATGSWTFPGVDTWFDVEIVRSGTNTTVKVNGATVFDNVGQPELGAGKVGLQTSWNQPKYDNVMVTENSGGGTGTTYYVDATNGNDANDGLSPSTAWQTVAKVNASTFVPGDSVLFKAGETWNEQLTVPSSGDTGQPIRFGAYDSGDKPRLDLTEALSSEWVGFSGNIWVRDVGFEVRQVFLDDAYLPVARHPNDAWLRTDDDSSDHTHIIDNDIPTGDLVGADIRVWPRNWRLDESTITSVVGNRINYQSEPNSGLAAQGNRPYVVANKLWMLDAPGEWYYDSSAGQLYLWMPDSSDPNGKDIRASRYRFGVHAQGKRQIVIEDLAINGAFGAGVRLDDTTEFTVQRLDITNVGMLRTEGVWEDSGQGILVSRNASLDTEEALIRQNSILNATHQGIEVYHMAHATVAENVIEQVGTVGWDWFLPSAGTGIEIVWVNPNAVIRRNTIRDISWSGISFRSQNNLIEENVIERPMQWLVDGGGIYGAQTSAAGSIVRRNIILDALGNTTYGIYFDVAAEGVTAEFNTVANVQRGSQNHFGRNNTFQDNTFYVLEYAVRIQEDMGAPGPAYTTGNIYRRNIYFSKAPSELVRLSNGQGDHFDFGTYSDNVFSNRDPSRVVHKSGSTFPATFFSLPQWQAQGNESGSVFVPQAGSSDPDADSIFLVNKTPDPLALPNPDGRTYTDLDGVPVAWPITLPGFSSRVLLWAGE